MARFALATTTDYSAYLWIATLLSLLYTTLALLVRAWIKRVIFGWEDAALLSAQALARGQYIAIMVGLTNGLGRSVDLLTDTRETVGVSAVLPFVR